MQIMRKYINDVAKKKQPHRAYVIVSKSASAYQASSSNDDILVINSRKS